MLRSKGHIDVVGKLGDVVIPPISTIVQSPPSPAPTVEKQDEPENELAEIDAGEEDGPVGLQPLETEEIDDAEDDTEYDGEPGDDEEDDDDPLVLADASDQPAPFQTGLPRLEGDAGGAAVRNAPVQPVEMPAVDPVVTVEPDPVVEPEPVPAETAGVNPMTVSDLDPVAAPVVEPIDMVELEPVVIPAADQDAVPDIEPVEVAKAPAAPVPDVEPVVMPKLEPLEVPAIDPLPEPEAGDVPAPGSDDTPPAANETSLDAKDKDTSEWRGEGEMPGPSGFGGGMPAMHHQAGGKFGWFCGFEDEDDLQIIIGGDADAIGEHTFADGKITGMIEDKGFVTVGRATAVFEASADDGDGGFAVATAETFAEVTGADFVFTFTREWNSDDEGGFSSTAADKSVTTVYAIDFEFWSPRHTIEVHTTFGTGEFEPDILPDGNISTFEADLKALGDDTFVELFSDAFAVEDQFSTVSGVATLIG